MKINSIEREIAMELFHLLQKHCPLYERMDVETVINSWGDTLTSEQVLQYLKDIKRDGRLFEKIFATVGRQS